MRIETVTSSPLREQRFRQFEWNPRLGVEGVRVVLLQPEAGIPFVHAQGWLLSNGISAADANQSRQWKKQESHGQPCSWFSSDRTKVPPKAKRI